MHLWKIGVQTSIDLTYYYVVAETARRAIERVVTMDRGGSLRFEDGHIRSCEWIGVKNILILQGKDHV